MQRQRIGAHYEKKAERYLQRRLWRTVSTNYHCRGGEIDLIMQHMYKRHLIFVEVRYRSHAAYGGGLCSIDEHKQKKIIQTAQHFLSRYPDFYHFELRFDVICFKQDQKIDWIQDAFRVQ